ncbi:MAG TPA: hypothetical protein VFU41_08145 [Gemmatimonadales bacterium]|nr:hypothetical protein [Gemmatimonadales bacterium]
MTQATSERHGLAHAVFLERLAGESAETMLQARLAQAAFLALRLADWLGPDRDPVHPDAFQYQYLATERLCRQLPADCTETGHVWGLVHSALDAFRGRDVRLAVPALFAYAHYLEDELRLEEALDVLETLLRTGSDRLPPSDAIASRLRMARVLRKLNYFDEAEQVYDDAGVLAVAEHDSHSELLSRVGRAYTLIGRGNLMEAEQSLRDILTASQSVGDRPAQALAHQGIAVALGYGGQVAKAIPHLWRALELYDDDLSRTRALGDLGTMLLTLGDAEGAQRALNEVVRRGGTGDVLSNALIELMHCASYRRDRVGFERFRDECEARMADASPNILADFHLKAGIGHARFGRVDRAEALLTTALAIAEQAGVNELVFRIERIRSGLRDCQEELQRAPQPAAEPVQSDAVREVSASLARLAV